MSAHRDWLAFAEMFRYQIIPEPIKDELLGLTRGDDELARVIYGVFGPSSLNFMRRKRRRDLGGKSPAECIASGKLDDLHIVLMLALVSDQEKENIKNYLTSLHDCDPANWPWSIAALLADESIPKRKRVLISWMLDEMTQEERASCLLH